MPKTSHQDQALAVRRGESKVRDLPKDDQSEVKRLLANGETRLREKMLRDEVKTVNGVHYKFRNLVCS